MASRRRPGTAWRWVVGVVLGIAVLSASPVAASAPDRPPRRAVDAAVRGPGEVEAETTRIVVRVVSRGAKVIGSSVGGARVWLRDPTTGEVLARGTQRGSTGDTAAIMREAHRTGEPVYSTASSAHAELVVELRRPRRVEVVAEAPLGMPEAAQRATRTTWLLPGVDLTGEGIVLELAGLVVSVEEPFYRVDIAGDGDLEIRARVTMLCGCPIVAGGLWDAGVTRVWAEVRQEGGLRATVPLQYAGEANLFRAVRPAGQLDLEPGPFEVAVLAARPQEGNTGIDRTVATFRE